jgi:hypothetical protein
MAVIHTATMTFARRLANVETIEQQDSAERAPAPPGRRTQSSADVTVYASCCPLWSRTERR